MIQNLILIPTCSHNPLKEDIWHPQWPVLELKKSKSTTSASTVAAKKSRYNLGISTQNGSVSIQTEEEEEQDYAQQGIEQIIISDEEGNITSVKDVSSDVIEEEDDEVKLNM